MHIALYIVFFWSGLILGFIIAWWAAHILRSYSGVINIDSDEMKEKTVYSLVLFGDPEKLIYEKEVLFKVDSSEEKAGRE